MELGEEEMYVMYPLTLLTPLERTATTRDGAEEGRAHGPKTPSEVKMKFGMATAGGNHLLVAGMRVTFDLGPHPLL